MSRKKRSLKPRTRESVTERQLDADADNGRSLIPRGDYSINPNMKEVRLERARCYENGKLVIRVWPMLDPEDPENNLLNGRLNDQGIAGLGGMAVSEPALCVEYAGLHKDSGHDFMISDNDRDQCSYIIARSKRSVYEGVTFWDLPYPKLYTTAKDAFKTGKFGNGKMWNPQWNILMQAEKAALSSFKQRYYVVCSVLENGSGLDLIRERREYKKDGKNVVEEFARNGVALGDSPDDPLIVMKLAVSGGRKLLKLCNIQKDDWTGNGSVDPAGGFKYGDPTGVYDPESNTVKGGLFFTIYNPEVLEISKHSTFKGSVDEKGVAVQYEAAVSNRHNGPEGVIKPSLSSAQVDNIFNKQCFLWKDSPNDPVDSYLLHEPTIEERCVLLAKAFRGVPKLLEFGWMSHPEYLEFDSVQAILKNRTTSSGTAKPDLDDDVPFDSEESGPTSAADIADEFDDEELEEGDDVEETEEEGEEFEDEGEDEFGEEEEEYEEEGDEEFDEEGEEYEEEGDEEFEEEDDADFDDEGDGEEEEEGEEEEADEFEEASSESEDFDAFDDEQEGADEELEEQLEGSLSKAKAISRSRKRSSKEPTKKVSTKPSAGKQSKKKRSKTAKSVQSKTTAKSAKSAKSSKSAKRPAKTVKSSKSAKQPAKGTSKKSSKLAKSVKRTKKTSKRRSSK